MVRLKALGPWGFLLAPVLFQFQYGAIKGSSSMNGTIDIF